MVKVNELQPVTVLKLATGVGVNNSVIVFVIGEHEPGGVMVSV